MPVHEVVSKVRVEPTMPHKATQRKTLVQGVINSAIAVTAFLITCIGLHAVLPFPEIDGRGLPEIPIFSAHKDEFDTLFIGSSRIYFQISPAIFDRVMVALLRSSFYLFRRTTRPSSIFSSESLTGSRIK